MQTKKKIYWGWNLNTATLTLIPAAVGINYAAKALAEGLKLPLWLGSLGTFLASMLAGPIPGAISGAINNIIYGLTLSPISTVYALTSIFIGAAVGILFQKGWFTSGRKVILAGISIALISAIVSTPLNLIFWGGQSGVVWGDSLLAFLRAQQVSLWLASFADEFILDLIDKIVVSYIAWIIYRQLPQSLIRVFKAK
jgi:energy-coupling factor transport system substrate-specific component